MPSPAASSFQEPQESGETPTDSPTPSPDNTALNEAVGEQHDEAPPPSARPIRKYTRRQLVLLSASPLVKPPLNMPELKVWFGTENENSVKKDDPPTSGGPRERRYRRDAEEGDVSARPSFRTALTQPSQMGNFKHQSLRPSDRDRDREREGDKERERDMREKEGHERLRHLSDKYDRDRLSLPLATRKDREVAPHLNANSARTQQSLSSNAASRRGDARETIKKKVGEASEDWRRGAEPPRPSREDRIDNGRERTRDSSRPKRDASLSRRDREEPRDKPQRGDRERDDHRRDKDVDGEEDSRRWRDDGKRDERIATSRRERGRDKPNNDHTWEGNADKRWATNDDRAYKRSSARERKPGNPSDDTKDKDERKDKEREKEKEPAWMDTYVPNEATQGILGGHSSTGELDGIQAWKKGLKEKESKEKEASLPPSKSTTVDKASQPATLPGRSEAMDEIQLFKLLMKQEEEKKKNDLDDIASKSDHALQQMMKQESTMASTSKGRENAVEDSLGESYSHGTNSETIRPQAQSTPAFSSTSPPPFPPGLKDLAVSNKASTESSQGRTSSEGREPINLGASHDLHQPTALKPTDSVAVSSFQPPPGSRLLAFARPPIKAPNSDNSSNTLQTLNGGLPNVTSDSNIAFSKHDSPRPQSGFSPFDDQTRPRYGFDEQREANILVNTHHRIPIEQNFSSNVNSPMETNYNGLGAKGSRFAKFFDGKGRDGTASGKPQLQGGFTSPSPNHGQRQDHPNINQGNPGDQRAMEELFAMLNNSSQRGNVATISNPLLNHNGGFSSPGSSLHAHQQQHLIPQPQHHSNRLEPLYDSRSDDRSFVPDGMVPGLRPIPPPPPRGREPHFVEHVDDPMHYNYQRLPPPHNQQQQSRNLDPLYPTPTSLYAQQGRPNAGLNLQNLQQPNFRGGPSPNSAQGVPIPNGPQQRLPPGLANLGGRPPHEPNQFLGMPNLPTSVPHNPLHTNSQLQNPQLPFSNFNATSAIGFNGMQVRGPVPGPHLHNSGAPLGNNALPNLDPRLSGHHHLMGLGGSAISGNRLNGGFPQQGPAQQAHLAMRSQQQQPQSHLPPHMLPHLIPPHLQQGHPNSTNQSHDLMALLLGGPHRE
ncbi:hypothetical protein JR316_0000833 [Psilocybe cubensis]|uniref:Uncharacterized protein n=2 Tax=Psilocybe cubensis TaxID=181762 RepID=A0A8H7YAP4_PSICU|nr:hypothetical protein JR316_0000833 [Psilocybe cubensis]KAH9486768.1 hypothetical protein JR316_0000833 [Psilocybe cubensis]